MDFKCIASLTIIIIFLAALIKQTKSAYVDLKGFNFTHCYVMISSRPAKRIKIRTVQKLRKPFSTELWQH